MSNQSSTRRIPRALAVVGLALFFLLAAAGPLAAQTTTTTQPKADPNQVVNSWALTPCGDDPTQPGARPTFSYTLSPGATQDDCLQVWNFGNSQLTFHVYPADAFNNTSGAFDLVDEGAKSKDAGSWVKVAQDYVTLPASSSIRLPMTITVPANATPGDHSAGIVASSQTPARDQNGGQVLLNRRVGSRFYLRVAGPTTPALVTEDVSTTYHPSVNPLDGSLDVTYTVRNNGNVRLGAHQTVAVHDVFGTVDEARPKDLPEVLPGNSVTLTQHFSGIAATVRVGADVTIKPFAPGSSADKTVTAKTTTVSATTWAIPWTLLIALVVLALVVYFVRRRRRRDDGTPDVGEHAGGGPGYEQQLAGVGAPTAPGASP